jgi:ABC-2 type transport system permease protein
MSAMVPQAPAATSPPYRAGMKVTPVRVITSEWTKFRSLRSSTITLLVAVVLTIGLGTLISAVTAAQWSQAPLARRLTFNAITTSLDGVNISQLAIGVLGVLLISGEYATGMIRSSLTAVPKRLPVLWGKLAVFTTVTITTMMAACFAAFFLGQTLLASHHLQVGLESPHALRRVLGASLYLTLVGVIGLALGGLFRNTAAGISALVALFFVVPPVLNLLPASWSDHLGQYLPASAGEAFWGSPSGSHLAPGVGLGVLLLWAVVLVALAALRLQRVDA